MSTRRESRRHCVAELDGPQRGRGPSSARVRGAGGPFRRARRPSDARRGGRRGSPPPRRRRRGASGQGHVPDAAEQHVAGASGRGGRSDRRWSGDRSGRGRCRRRSPGCGSPAPARRAPAGPASRGAAGGSAASGTTCAQQRALVRRPERHERLHPPVAALPLHVVAGDQPAEAVPDDVHPVVAGLLADPLDVRAEVGRAAGDVGRAAGCSSRCRRGRSPRRRRLRCITEKTDRLSTRPCTRSDGDARRQRVGGEQGAHGGGLARRAGCARRGAAPRSACPAGTGAGGRRPRPVR